MTGGRGLIVSAARRARRQGGRGDASGHHAAGFTALTPGRRQQNLCAFLRVGWPVYR